MTLQQLIIIGAGGFGRETLAWARQSIGFETEWTLKGFIDDNLDALAGKNTPARVIGRLARLRAAPGGFFVHASVSSPIAVMLHVCSGGHRRACVRVPKFCKPTGKISVLPPTRSGRRWVGGVMGILTMSENGDAPGAARRWRRACLPG